MGRWAMMTWLVTGSLLVASHVQAMGIDDAPVVATSPLPVESRSAATVGGRLFNRRHLQIHDGDSISQAIRSVATDADFEAGPVSIVDSIRGDAPMTWHEPHYDELAAMDSLTVSVLDVPAAAAAGAAILAALWLARLARQRRTA